MLLLKIKLIMTENALNGNDILSGSRHITALFIMWFYTTACHFLPLRAKYYPQHLVLSLISSIRMRDHVPYSYKTTNKLEFCVI
jgi:hypothetical protein